VIGGRQLAERPAVLTVPSGQGHLVLFGFNPLHRYQAHGLFSLVWNSIIHWDQLGVGLEAEPEPDATE